MWRIRIRSERHYDYVNELLTFVLRLTTTRPKKLPVVLVSYQKKSWVSRLGKKFPTIIFMVLAVVKQLEIHISYGRMWTICCFVYMSMKIGDKARFVLKKSQSRLKNNKVRQGTEPRVFFWTN